MSGTDNSYISLSDDELALLAKNGDEAAFDTLAFRYLGVINAVSRRFSAEGYEQKDFVQEGLLGLMYACKSYNPDASASFKTYMSVVVERRLISIIRRSSAKHVIPSENLVTMDDLSEAVEDTALAPEEALMLREHLKAVFKRLRAKLSETEYDVLMLYCSSMSYRQIAQELSITEKSVDNALQRARKKIGSEDMS